MSSSIIVDDTDPRFNYKDNAWTAGGQSGEFDSTAHSSSVAGAQVVFGPFTGTSIAVFSTVGTSQPRVHFFVDSGAQSLDTTAQTNSAVTFQQQVYSASNLDSSAEHTLQINLLDAGPFTLDYSLVAQQSTSSTSTLTSHTYRRTLLFDCIYSPKHRGYCRCNTAYYVVYLPTTSAVSVASSSASSLTSITASSDSPPLTSSLAATAFPSESGANQAATTNASSTTPSTTSVPIIMGALRSGPDATVIGSVTAVVLYLRRRRLTQPGRSIPNNKTRGFGESRPQSRHRPSLHLSIPNALHISRSPQNPSSILPTHNKSSSSSADPSAMFASNRPMPAFLAEDPNESPVTMTTRVTVGTTIGQRVSVGVPDFSYQYAYPETPTAKSANVSPSETGMSSATGSGINGYGLGGGGQVAKFDSTSIYASSAERGTTTMRPGVSASRPLPFIPTSSMAADVHSAGDRAALSVEQSHGHRYLPTTPNSIVETVIHQDAGVRLAANAQGRPRRELPPPYQDYEIA
ncbi:hypothetical protein DFH11DRAFT_1771668 [Phellopilus nigrolimitatus]|nr:hypothetical protein DFH11DRAFT_1771668 [Phellopilus nigrolimitatus]